jgi:hypothetical protein
VPHHPPFVDRHLDTGAWHLCDAPTSPGMSVHRGRPEANGRQPK